MIDVLGWTGVVLFFVGAWIMGSRDSKTRRLGILLMSGTNALFAAQATLTDNWSLLALSVGPSLLQMRVWIKWRMYDGK